MKPLKNTVNSSVAEIIENRSPARRQDSVQGWHNLLKKLLSQMTPYLKDGHLVTFRTLNDREREFFEELHRKVTLPPTVSAIYMPPSVRFQMMYHRPEGESQAVPDHSLENPHGQFARPRSRVSISRSIRFDAEVNRARRE